MTTKTNPAARRDGAVECVSISADDSNQHSPNTRENQAQLIAYTVDRNLMVEAAYG